MKFLVSCVGQNQNKHARNNIRLKFFSFKVKHFLLNGRVCLGIFSSCPLPKGTEITIPFEFQFEEYHSYMDCACRQEMCAVMKYNSKNQNQNHDAHAQKRLKPHEEDSNSNSLQKMSPLRVSLPNSHGLQVRNNSWRRLLFISLPREIRYQTIWWRSACWCFERWPFVLTNCLFVSWTIRNSPINWAVWRVFSYRETVILTSRTIRRSKPAKKAESRENWKCILNKSRKWRRKKNVNSRLRRIINKNKWALWANKRRHSITS